MVISAVYFLITAYATFCLSTGLRLNIIDEKKFAILWPFSSKPFLLGDYNLPYILFDFILILGFYGLFFLLTANVFKLFFQPKLFTLKGIRQLKWFYLLNLILPGTCMVLAHLFSYIEEGIEMLVVIHFILGIFAYFLAAIFSQGVKLQNEQDLFI
ncbi:hypothetical protein [Pedobacter montanisoli]|uniref:DUF2975 domain-containing protein n=1 Tax=Pedobacter montanisoli TaxID=2923277 RepID=A0ABS9ZSF2_9SPHI|nr:hypothetical protein [Pedobacter montanisoli]MCJ0741268.1 hypothetical protein [Pedobacter montanisoli]